MSVSTSVESVKIKPNCEGRRRGEGHGQWGEDGGGRRGVEEEEEEEGIWLKALPDTSTQAFCCDPRPPPTPRSPPAVAFATSALANRAELPVMMMSMMAAAMAKEPGGGEWMI